MRLSESIGQHCDSRIGSGDRQSFLLFVAIAGFGQVQVGGGWSRAFTLRDELNKPHKKALFEKRDFLKKDLRSVELNHIGLFDSNDLRAFNDYP
jgi:hypothetical protein